MRNINCNVLSGVENSTVVGSFVDANQLVSASFHAYFSDASGTGKFTLQASNDIAPARNMVAIDNFAPTHWVELPNQVANITGGTPAILTIKQVSYRWLRAYWVGTGIGAGTVNVNMDALSV